MQNRWQAIISTNHVCTVPLGLKSLSSTPFIHQWISSALIQIMAFTYSAPSHYLNQCWHIVNWTIGNKFQWNFNRNSNIFIQENAFENVLCQNGTSLTFLKIWFLSDLKLRFPDFCQVCKFTGFSLTAGHCKFPDTSIPFPWFYLSELLHCLWSNHMK